MKNIGGEMEFKNDGLFRCLTDSGRSSLRLILKSVGAGKRILLPDFLCAVVLDVVRDLGMSYGFYKVRENLRSKIECASYDIVYFIDYFGQRNNAIDRRGLGQDKVIIEDAVFLPDFSRPTGVKNWIGFNSFRKISPLADGSLVKSTIPLKDLLSIKGDPAFSKMKYRAKQIKHEYFAHKQYSQRLYLSLFKKAEALLGSQKSIHTISNESLHNLFGFYAGLEKERAVRLENYRTLVRQLGRWCLNLKPDFPSFFVLRVGRRDELRAYLSEKNVFLPVHWPPVAGTDNGLYWKIISIPVDSRYTNEDMNRVASYIRKFYLK